MKKYSVKVFLLGILLSSINQAHADASYLLKRCQAKAGDVYDLCNSNGYSKRCESKYDRMMDNCTSQFNEQTQAESNGAFYDNNGRFVPTEIPQRQQYVSPGMQ